MVQVLREKFHLCELGLGVEDDLNVQQGNRLVDSAVVTESRTLKGSSAKTVQLVGALVLLRFWHREPL